METLEKLLEEINKLKESHELLRSVYLENGPYGDGKISTQLRYKINDYFGFDDSE